MINKLNILLSFSTIVFILGGCEYRHTGIVYGDNTITVTGINTITDTMIINPGTVVFFNARTINYFLNGVQIDHGTLLISSSGTLIAQGTGVKPIIFETEDYDEGHITFDATASNESVLEYCELKSNVYFTNQSSSITIRNCTSNGSPLR